MEDQRFETSDLHFTAYLQTLGINFENTRIDDGKTIFVFEKNKKIEDAVNLFLKDDPIPIRIKSFIRALRDLKFLIKHPLDFRFERKGNNHG